MSNFLWVEDFGGSTLRDTTVNVFGEFLPNQEIPETKKEVKNLLKQQGIFVELSFLGGLNFIRNPKELLKIDYIILDIWLDVKIRSDKDQNNWLPTILEKYYGYEPQSNEAADEKSLIEAKKKLLNVAGYQLYVELVMEHGFPKEHILFCSDHADQQKSIQDNFKQAKVELPLLLSKDDKTEVQTWVKKHKENPYSVLRRGIINGCKHLQSLLETQQQAAIQFDKFIKTNNNSQQLDMLDYLETLQNQLPLRKPDNPQRFYKLFIRNLAHEWDAAYPDNLAKSDRDFKYSFAWIMKHARNWAAHTTELDELTEQDVAFLFIVAMRAMFKLSESTEQYETILLNMFDKTDCDLMKNQIGTTPMNTQLPLSDTYLAVKNKIFQSKASDALYFNTILNNMINNQVEFDYVTGLYQMFWHGLSPVRLYDRGTTIDRNKNIVFKYSFRLNDYGKTENSFLFELARSIYKRSFS